MDVILKEDIKGLGKKGDKVTVKEGYGRNFLIKNGKAVEATAKNLNDLKLEKKHEEKVAKEKLDAAKALADELNGKQVKMSLKTGSNGRSFGSISTKEIAVELKKQLGHDIDKKKMSLDQPIKAPGGYNLKIKLHQKVTAEVKVMVEEA
ncbi:MAG: 50S ribosomal protein L9 [Lachnospiraceae bacterium]|nr:50S ribosomal protein L9 [Lachnospiraceae bacterium]